MSQLAYEPMLDRLQRDAFAYFVNEVNPANGLVKDCTRPGFPSSIAAVGLALAAYPVGVERGLLTRAEAVARALTTLRFFWTSPQGPSRTPPATRGSTITSLTWTPDGAPGTVNCPPLTRRSCSQGR